MVFGDCKISLVFVYETGSIQQVLLSNYRTIVIYQKLDIFQVLKKMLSKILDSDKRIGVRLRS